MEKINKAVVLLMQDTIHVNLVCWVVATNDWQAWSCCDWLCYILLYWPHRLSENVVDFVLIVDVTWKPFLIQTFNLCSAILQPWTPHILHKQFSCSNTCLKNKLCCTFLNIPYFEISLYFSRKTNLMNTQWVLLHLLSSGLPFSDVN